MLVNGLLVTFSLKRKYDKILLYYYSMRRHRTPLIVTYFSKKKREIIFFSRFNYKDGPSFFLHYEDGLEIENDIFL